MFQNPRQFGTFFRQEGLTALVLGTLEQPSDPDVGLDFYLDSPAAVEALDGRIIEDNNDNFEKIYEFLEKSVWKNNDADKNDE